MRIAALDLGSNSFHLLIADAHSDGTFEPMVRDKEMLRLCSVRCPHMNEITLEDTLAALQHTQYVVEVPEEIRRRAARAVERMLAVG